MSPNRNTNIWWELHRNEDEEEKTLLSEFGDDYTGLFDRVEDKLFRNKNNKYLAFVKIKPGRGKESYVWAVLDVDTDEWKEE